ncbi:hypothetical protein AB0903_17140 [Streptomyces sp. NPDC048389]|uniref:hypothetical protein n=1 Tax=Streptomyces sp. NPDC048389 TaxID=3154622 RepID=UPI0034531D64
MNQRPYPNAARARRQIERTAYLRACPWCKHPEKAHAVEDGQRVCTRGQGLVSCRSCAELWAWMPAVAAMTELGRVLASPPVRVRTPRLTLGALVAAGVGPGR